MWLAKSDERINVLPVALLTVALAFVALAGTASAHLTGAYTRFTYCPYKTAGVDRCAYSLTSSGEVVLGSKKVPIVNPVILQGGYTEAAEEGPEVGYSEFVGATNGETLSKAAQPVPGGLLGLVPPASSPPLVKAAVEAAAKNGFSEVNSTLELARPASEIKINENHLAEGQGVTLVLPLKAHLENQFLGGSCYVGSSANPIIWELRTDTTKPPAPNEPITGNPGSTNFLEEGRIVELEGVTLVDNSWAAPGAEGCGGLLSSLVDPVLDLAAGLPAAAGHNSAVLNAAISEAKAFSVNKNDVENP